MSDRLILRQPDDWHVHLRDGAMLRDVAPYTAAQFARAIVMPNLSPPVVNTADCIAYRNRIRAAVSDRAFAPLMTIYLTDTTQADDVVAGFAAGVVAACKLYPAHATTNSAHGVSDITHITPVLAAMERAGMPLLVHGEVTDPAVDIFDREAEFIARVLRPLIARHPALKVVFEHITTQQAVDFVEGAPDTVAATITPHHLMLNRNAMFVGGIRPHAYCLPVAKREVHRLALRRAAVSSNPKFFLGTDSAPHPISAKESACGCAGIFNAANAIEAYARVFDEEDALDRLEGFASLFGPRFYNLPLNPRRILLERAETVVPDRLTAGDTQVVPFLAGQTLSWRFAGLVAD